jgi:hypothetical protein
MSWTQIKPLVFSSPMVSICVIKLKKMGLQAKLKFADTFLQDFTDSKRCNVMVGDGENAGKLRVEFTPDGPFKLNKFAKGGGYINMVADEVHPMLDRIIDTFPCKTEDASAEGVTIVLPLEQWADFKRHGPDGTRLLEVKREASAAQPKPPESNGHDDKRIDAVSYLIKRGYKASRNEDGSFNIGGKQYRKDQVLSQLNVLRKNSDLEPIRAEDFF